MYSAKRINVKSMDAIQTNFSYHFGHVYMCLHVCIFISSCIHTCRIMGIDDLMQVI